MKTKYCIECKVNDKHNSEEWKVNLLEEISDNSNFLYIIDLVEKDSDYEYWTVLEAENIEKALMLGISRIRISINDCEG